MSARPDLRRHSDLVTASRHDLAVHRMRRISHTAARARPQHNLATSASRGAGSDANRATVTGEAPTAAHDDVAADVAAASSKGQTSAPALPSNPTLHLTHGRHYI